MRFGLLAVTALLVASLQPEEGQRPEIWRPMEYFVGSWEGEESGQVGTGKGQRQYAFVLGEKFLQVKNRSVFEPQEKNPKGEVHEDLGMISYDRIRKTYVLREFHVEGYVNRYAGRIDAEKKQIVFTSESIENLEDGWRARLTWVIEGPDRFRETFELARPAKEFEVLLTSRWKRAK